MTDDQSTWPDLGGFIMSGNDPTLLQIAPHCKRGSISWCLGAARTGAYFKRFKDLPTCERPKRPTWRISRDENHNVVAGVIGLTLGEYRYERPMTPDEISMADKFDKTGKLPPRRQFFVSYDLSDPAWSRKAKAVGGGHKGAENLNGQGDRERHTIRDDSLQQFLAAYPES